MVLRPLVVSLLAATAQSWAVDVVDDTAALLQISGQQAAQRVSFVPHDKALQLAQQAFEHGNLIVSAGAAISQLNGNVEPTTALRKDLPVALYGAGEATGIVYQPIGSVHGPQVTCAFPIDSASNRRIRMTGQRCHGEARFAHSGQCNHVGLENAPKYSNYILSPQILKSKVHVSDETCFLRSVDKMVTYQKAMLQHAGKKFSYLKGLDRGYNGPTLYNEVEIKNHGKEAVIAVFWAHGGAFKKGYGINNGNGGACAAVDNRMYRDAVSKAKLTVFEVAGATLAGKGGSGYGTIFDRAANGLKAWYKHQVRSFSEHFRVVPRSSLRKCRSFGMHMDFGIHENGSTFQYSAYEFSDLLPWRMFSDE